MKRMGQQGVSYLLNLVSLDAFILHDAETKITEKQVPANNQTAATPVGNLVAQSSGLDPHSLPEGCRVLPVPARVGRPPG